MPNIAQQYKNDRSQFDTVKKKTHSSRLWSILRIQIVRQWTKLYATWMTQGVHLFFFLSTTSNRNKLEKHVPVLDQSNNEGKANLFYLSIEIVDRFLSNARQNARGARLLRYEGHGSQSIETRRRFFLIWMEGVRIFPRRRSFSVNMRHWEDRSITATAEVFYRAFSSSSCAA